MKSAGLFRRNLFLNSLKTSTLTLILWPVNSGVLTSLLLPHLSSSLTDSLPSLNHLCHSKTGARFIQDAPKAVWYIPYVSVASFFPSLKQNFITYRSSKVSLHSDCIFEIHQLWQSGFSRVYSNCYCSCSFEAEIIKIGQSAHKIYSNNILNFQESTTILNTCTKKSGNLLNASHTLTYGKLPAISTINAKGTISNKINVSMIVYFCFGKYSFSFLKMHQWGMFSFFTYS